ncbi:MAG: FHA domain-containing protein, partial [Christensenella sp.]
MQTAYEITAYALRYWFIAAMLVILIAVIYISYKEYQQKKYVRTELSQFDGYAKVIGGPREFIGDRFGLGVHNSVGSDARCDIVLPDASVRKNHASIFKEDDNYYIEPAAKAPTKINGRIATTAHKLKTGDALLFGDVELRVY